MLALKLLLLDDAEWLNTMMTFINNWYACTLELVELLRRSAMFETERGR